MTAVMVSMSSAVTWRRLGMPALLTRRSTPPKASSTSTASWSTALESARLTTHIRLSGECFMQRPTTSESNVGPAGADADYGAPLGQRLGQAGADARRAPGHQRAATLQVQGHRPPHFRIVIVLTLGTAGSRRVLTIC